MEEDYERKKGEGVHAFRSSTKILAHNKTQWPRQSGCCFLWLATHQKTCWEILCNISVPCHSTFWLPHRSDDWPGMKFDCNNSTSFIRAALCMRNADRGVHRHSNHILLRYFGANQTLTPMKEWAERVQWRSDYSRWGTRTQDLCKGKDWAD